MKALVAITIYVLFKDLPLDAILGIIAGASFAMLCALVFVGPTPSLRLSRQPKPIAMPAKRHAPKARKAAYVFVPTNYEWSVA